MGAHRVKMELFRVFRREVVWAGYGEDGCVKFVDVKTGCNGGLHAEYAVWLYYNPGVIDGAFDDVQYVELIGVRIIGRCNKNGLCQRIHEEDFIEEGDPFELTIEVGDEA